MKTVEKIAQKDIAKEVNKIYSILVFSKTSRFLNKKLKLQKINKQWKNETYKSTK